MANREEPYSPEIHCLFVETSLDTRLVLLVHNDENISDFKDKLCKEHKQVFPEFGKINILALKVKRRRQFYHFSDSMNVCKAFEGISKDWFMYVDAVRFEKGEMLTIMAADQNRSNLEKKKEIAVDSVLVNGLETKVDEKKTRKRKIKSSDGKISRKKRSVGVDQSAVASTELCGNVQAEVASHSCAIPQREELDDNLTGAVEKDLGKGVKTAELVKIGQEKDLPLALELENRQITSRDDERGEGSRLAPSAVDNLPTAEMVTHAENKLEARSGLTTGAATEKKRKRSKSSKDQSTAAATTTPREIENEIKEVPVSVDFVEATSKSCPISESEIVEVEAIQKETEMCERSAEDVGKDNIELASHLEYNVEAESGLTANPVIEKKNKRKKSSKDHINHSASAAATTTATTTSREIVNDINGVPGNVGRVDATSKSCPISERENLGNSLVQAIQKSNETETREKSAEDEGRDNTETDNLTSHPEKHLEANNGLTTSPVIEKKKRRKKSSKDDINQSVAAATTTAASREIVNEINVDSVDAISASCPLSRKGELGQESEIVEVEAIPKETEMCERSAEDVGKDNIELASHLEIYVEAKSGLSASLVTEKKEKCKKSSKDHINHSASIATTTTATTTSREIVNDINEVPGNVGRVDATSKSCPISERENLGNSLVQAMQKSNETETCEKSAEDEGRGNIETDNLTSHPEKHLEANNGLTTSPVIEKKKRRKKSSKDGINQSVAAATTTAASREIVNEINVDSVDAISASCPLSRKGDLGQENEMGEKIDEDVRTGKAIPSSADNTQINNLVSYPENQLEVSSGMTADPAKEKKKKQRKSSKDHIKQSTAATSASRKLVNEREKVSESIDRVEATSEYLSHSRGEKLADNLVEATENENEMCDQFVEKVGSREATLIGADKIQAVDNLQVAGLVSTPHALVHESKTLDDTRKLTDENASCEQEVSKEKDETDASQAKSVKSTKKKSSKKTKTSAKEDTMVAQNIEPIKVFDGEGPDNVIRNVLDSLQQRNETEENLEKIGKKSSKSLKKKHTLNIVEAQGLDSLQQRNKTEGNLDKSGKKSSNRSKTKHSSNVVEAQMLSVEVNNAAPEDAHPINNPKDTDASFTLAKKDTARHASHFEKSIEVVDHSDASNKKEAVKKSSNSATVNKSKMNVNNKVAVRKNSNSVTVNKSKINFFKDDEKSYSAEDDSKMSSYVSTKTPSDSSTDGDSDVTSMSRKQGNNLAGGTNTFSGSLQDLLRNSKSYKKAKLTASQSQPDDDDSPAFYLDSVPDGQAN